MNLLRRKIGLLLAAVSLALVSGFFVTSPTVHAVANAQTLSSPPVEICDIGDMGGNCLNRSQGGDSFGTDVISYFPGDNNDDFGYLYLDAMCGGSGKVTLNCPAFGNANVNKAFHGYVLVGLEGAQTGAVPYCTGLNGQFYDCPDPDGVCPSGQDCTATIFVAVGCTQEYACGTIYGALNRYWTAANQGKSGYFDGESWVKVPLPVQQRIIIGYSTQQELAELAG